MIVDFVRHADTGRRGYMDGRSDPPLRTGAVDTPCLRHAGIAWTRAISSPLRRAHDTALALAHPLGLAVHAEAHWAELDFGGWDGQRVDALPAVAIAAFHADPSRNPPPGGERWDFFKQRIAGALQALLADAGGCSDDSEGPVLVVSHAGALRMALSQACGMPLAALWALRIDYGTRLRLRIGAGDDGRPWGELIELVQP